MKKIALILLSIVFSFSAYAAPKSSVYFTSWETDSVDLLKLSNKTTYLNLAFAKVNPDFTVESTDGILQFNLKNISPYISWTNYKQNNPNVKVMVAFGGATFGDMWLLLHSEENAQRFTQALLSVVNKPYPVYAKKGNSYVKVAEVAIDGIDLDFEIAGQRPEEYHLKFLAKVMKDFKKAAPNKILSLTGFHTAADPIECQNGGTSEQGCSFTPGSIHSGELLPLFTKYLDQNVLDFYQLMAYDADVNFDWKTAMANHAKYLPKNKLLLGLSLGTQWGEKGNFIEPIADLEKKIVEQKQLGYGGFMVWAIGAKGGHGDPDKQKQVDIINNFIYILNNK